MCCTHSSCGTVLFFCCPVSAPTMIHGGAASPAAPNVPKSSCIGSMLKNQLYVPCSNQAYFWSGFVTVVPYQKFFYFGSFPDSASCIYLFGFLVRNKYVCHGAACAASNTLWIHSSGTHSPNRSPMLTTNITAGFFFCAGIGRQYSRNIGSNFTGNGVTFPISFLNGFSSTQRVPLPSSSFLSCSEALLINTFPENLAACFAA